MDRPTYSLGDYTDYSDVYDAAFESHGGLANYLYFQDAAGKTIDPRQYIVGSEHFKKLSQEVRLATPQDWRARAIIGGFYQRQSDHIYQNYVVDNLAPDLSVNGWPGTLWLTLEDRVDRDWALFGEGEFDVTPQLTLIAGGRLYRYDNSLFGFAGFGKNPAYTEGSDFPPNAAGASSGQRRCLTVNGEQLLDDESSPLASGGVDGTPCTNVGAVESGQAVPKHTKGDGFIHRLSARFKPAEHLMFYATWSRGFRPGGLNRAPNTGDYGADFLTNYELGWKTSFGPITWNGAAYHQVWRKFQFSFLGANSLTVIQNGRDATVNGVESDVSYVAGGLSLNAAVAFTDAKTKGNICFAISDDEQCSQTYVLTASGTRLPVTPRFKGTATARYAWPMGSGKAHVQGNLTHQSSASTDLRQNVGGVNPNDIVGRIRASTVFDAATGYDWGKFTTELFVTNVFDERNDEARFVTCSICTVSYVLPGRPRTIGLRAGVKF